MKVSFEIFFLILFLPLAVHAQQPLPAGRTPVVHVETGYSNANVTIPSLGRLTLNGVDFGVTLDFNRHFGLDLAGSYARGEHLPVASQPSNLLTYAAGIVVYPLDTKHVSVRLRTLFGGARQEGSNIGSQGEFLTGFVNQKAWIVGGAVEYKLDRSWSLRFAADYLRSSFFNPDGNLLPQNNFRTGIGIVYTLGASHQRSR